VGKFNHNHCIRDVRAFINRSKPTGANYQLCTTFPQKVLTDESQTLAAANLLNSVVVQKML
jgi:UBX domain-containing protein 1